MLIKASRSPQSSPCALNQALTQFIPRQVLLDSKPIAMAGLNGDTKKEEKKKTKKSKSAKSKELILASVAAFLEKNELVKTLSAFRSETGIENAALTSPIINLENLFCSYESSKSLADAATDDLKGIDSGIVDASTKDEGEKAHDGSEHIHRKKGKHKNGTDVGTNTEINKHEPKNGLLAEIKDKEEEEKKKKNKLISHTEIAETKNLEDTYGIPNDTDNPVLKTDVNDEPKKKKKHKRSSDASHEDSIPKDHNKIKESVQEQIEELKSLTNNSSTLPAETNVEQSQKKKKKKKKEKVASNCTAENGREEHAEQDMTKSDSAEGKTAVSGEKIDNSEKKSYKKRKRASDGGDEALVENEIVTKVSKRVKVAGAEDDKETGTSTQRGKSDGELTIVDKKKTEESGDKSDRVSVASPHEQDPSSQDIQKESGGQKVANINLEKEKENGASAKSMKKAKRSAEPKTINAFQRVKVDEVKFADERLQDNSYWALDKAGSGYGAKAQEVLGQVKGRDFRHEKTKKKRGSYRGGQIDFESKSIKFDSDEE